MTTVNISTIDINLARYSYSVNEIIDEIFNGRLDTELQNFVKKELGIEKVYKAFDLKKIDFEDSKFLLPDILLNDMYVHVAQNALDLSRRKPSDIGLLITINDNQQLLDPSPTVEIVSRLNLKKDIRTQNFQGLACSALSEAIRNAAGYFSLGNDKDVLIVIGSYYTSWFLDRIKQISHFSIQNRTEFFNFIYFIMFSDVTAAAILSKENNLNNSVAQVEVDSIFSLKDVERDGYRKATISLAPDNKNRLIFDMKLNSKLLKERVGLLSAENISRLSKNFPNSYRRVKSWGFHTAGLKFVDYVRERCNVKKNDAKLTYDLMRETGNTGAVSSLQFIKESIERQILKNGDVGCIVDYGWEGADTFLYKAVK